MKSLVQRTAAAVLLTASTGALFGQEVTHAGEIAAAPEAVLSPRFAAAISSSAIDSKINIPSFKERHDRKINRIWVASMLAMGVTTGRRNVMGQARGQLTSSLI